MKKTIYLLAAVLLWAACGTVAAQTQVQTQTQLRTPAMKDGLAAARQLYDAGQWAAAEYEFLQVPGTVESETFAAFCAARSERSDAGDRLKALLIKYPDSPYANEVKFRAGVFEHDFAARPDADAARFTGASELLAQVDPRRLPGSERDEYHFKSGHSEFIAGNYEKARSEFERVLRTGVYAPHADYHIAYMDYSEGNYTAAKKAFAGLAANPSYEKIVPYYLLQIEFFEGNHPYVAENAPKLIPGIAMPRKAELARMAAQSNFRLENYVAALENMGTYRQLGGETGRAENYLTGFSLYMERNYKEAAEHLAQAAGADDPLSQNASYHLADTYLQLKDTQKALQSFSIAAASGHDPAITEDALFNYGKLLYETGGGRFNEAVNVLNRYLATYPGSSPRTRQAREYLIAAYYNSNDYEAAYNAIVQHPDPDNNVRAALQKITYFRALERWNDGDAAEALELLNTSSQYRYTTKYTALTSFWYGEILYSQGDYAAAIPKYEEYLRLSPTSEAENAMARYNLGYANFNLGHWARAGQWFSDFLDRHRVRDSYRADALNREGDIEHAQTAYWRAIEKYDAAAAVGTPEKYYSAYQRALMLGLVDRLDRKIESLQGIISGNNGAYVEDATYELGRTYITREGYADGARTLVGFIEKYPNSRYYLPALSNLGLAYLNMGDRTRSMKYYKMIVEHAPYSREAQDAMAGIRGIYVDDGDVDGYFAYARGAQVPTDVGEMHRDSLSFAAAERIYLSGDSARAIPALENYIDGDARGEYIPTALGYLSGLYFETGRWDEAAAAYRRTAELTADPVVRAKALEGYEKSSRRSSFARANTLRTEAATAPTPASAAERLTEAIGIYRTLSADTRTVEGAESAYRVIEYLYDTGDYTAAEDAVFAFSEKGTSHSRWLGEAFLTLGDIYVKQGDNFQARATYQSIVDGYSPDNDGIIAAAKERIANLK